MNPMPVGDQDCELRFYTRSMSCAPYGQSLGEGVPTHPSDELTTDHRIIEETASEMGRKSFQCLENGFHGNSVPSSGTVKKPRALRLLINARERRRMHDLNDALDDLRAVIPTSMMSYSEKPEDITKEEWMDKLNNVHIQRADMNRLIMNYLVTEGFKEAAEKFRMESGIEPNVDLDSLDERIKIREMVLKGQIQEAIALINSLHPELLDTNRYLYFHLQQQHLIELIRLRETEAALEFAQSQLAEQGEESRECLTEMERTLALLAFDNPEESPFGDLLNMMQRQKVWSEVNQAVLDYENRESTPKLAKLLKLLLWAQNELDQKKVKYSRMTDLSKGTIEDPK
ncbi:glucose-induced degradation 8-like protein [Labeo rohita]|uniref:Glucose-induced degradation 8-like protein n=1 Tax=Labeo rohita TaxID=84645 RepID=A0A498N367_LABRO|nr:glucose-induced degradation 8-like protein [Labeo rohita]RXN29421.1 glucose-induced degradation 8-like protein [Labeo rohita]